MATESIYFDQRVMVRGALARQLEKQPHFCMTVHLDL